MAAAARGGDTAGIIFHGDRGSQYMSGDYRKLIADLDMVQSVGRTGVCWDNAVAEVVLVIAQTRARAPLPVPRPGHGPAERSSPGSTATTHRRLPLEPRLHAAHRVGTAYTVNPRPTRPRNQRDRSTGGLPDCPAAHRDVGRRPGRRRPRPRHHRPQTLLQSPVVIAKIVRCSQSRQSHPRVVNVMGPGTRQLVLPTVPPHGPVKGDPDLAGREVSKPAAATRDSASFLVRGGTWQEANRRVDSERGLATGLV